MNCLKYSGKGKDLNESLKVIATDKQPCWEEHQCGRETAGANYKDLGVCLAYRMNLGNACWLVYGTFCGGKERKGWKDKQEMCSTCTTYLKYDDAHKQKMFKEWIDFDEPKKETWLTRKMRQEIREDELSPAIVRESYMDFLAQYELDQEAKKVQKSGKPAEA